MKKNSFKLYNLIFPIWLLWLIPTTWIIVLPANFLIDLIVVLLTMKYLKIKDIKKNTKLIVFRVWIFGFVADFIGTGLMFLSNIIDFNYETQFGKWWYRNISNAVSYYPFESIYAFIWVTVSVVIAACFIYLLNYKFSLRKSTLDDSQKKKLALALSIFTAPYLFYIPTSLFF
ncbi:hypothetical protein [Sporosalibacterium faouarense]|uniref:hypothetical protein n=1 Tax=Sporosalibacterium faouarense TaxID=516123 RepID=UPI00192B10B6|nr:hypothetical protein [Sporosalibacterium faouarense]